MIWIYLRNFIGVGVAPIEWFVTGDVKSLDTNLIKKTQEKWDSSKTKLLVGYSRQNYYTDCKIRDMSFKVGEQVLPYNGNHEV